jgi:hypothetical protein
VLHGGGSLVGSLLEGAVRKWRRPGPTTAVLLDHMGQFVRNEPRPDCCSWQILIGTEHDVTANCIRLRTDLPGRLRRARVRVYTYRTEIEAETRLHQLARPRFKRFATTATEKRTHVVRKRAGTERICRGERFSRGRHGVAIGGAGSVWSERSMRWKQSIERPIPGGLL